MRLFVLMGAMALLVNMVAGENLRAQSLNFSAKDGKPVEITADNGIEWQQDQQVFIARENARAVSGQTTILANELRAYYREKPGGGTDIWRMDALGDVIIKSPNETIYGGQAVYDVDNTILIISGGKVRLVTKVDTITADGQIEYWEKKKMAVARGNARAVRGNKQLRADVLAVYFRKNNKGANRAYRIDAFDDVTIITEKDRATADRGVYNVESGVATLTGSVEIHRGKNILKGCRAEINLDTGLSNLHSCKKSGSSGRVSGVLRQQKY